MAGISARTRRCQIFSGAPVASRVSALARSHRVADELPAPRSEGSGISSDRADPSPRLEAVIAIRGDARPRSPADDRGLALPRPRSRARRWPASPRGRGDARPLRVRRPRVAFQLLRARTVSLTNCPRSEGSGISSNRADPSPRLEAVIAIRDTVVEFKPLIGLDRTAVRTSARRRRGKAACACKPR